MEETLTFELEENMLQLTLHKYRELELTVKKVLN